MLSSSIIESPGFHVTQPWNMPTILFSLNLHNACLHGILTQPIESHHNKIFKNVGRKNKEKKPIKYAFYFHGALMQNSWNLIIVKQHEHKIYGTSHNPWNMYSFFPWNMHYISTKYEYYFHGTLIHNPQNM